MSGDFEKLQEVIYSCPFCEEKHNIQIRQSVEEALVKGEIIKHEQIEYYCAEEDDSFVPVKIMNENMRKAKDAYRVKHQLLTSYEIKKNREMYGLNQKELSKLLGWGDVTIQRYETKQIQDPIYDRELRRVKEDVIYGMALLIKNQSKFEDQERYEEIKNNLGNMVKEKKEKDEKIRREMIQERLNSINGLNDKISYNENKEIVNCMERLIEEYKSARDELAMSIDEDINECRLA